MIDPVVYLSDINNVYIIDLNEIIYVKAQRSYCKIFTVNGDEQTLSKPLGKLECKLPNKIFIRLGKSYLVNRNHIRRINKKDKVLILNGDIEISYSMKTLELLNKLNFSFSEDGTASWEKQITWWEDCAL